MSQCVVVFPKQRDKVEGSLVRGRQHAVQRSLHGWRRCLSMIWLYGMGLHRFGAHGLLWTDASANLPVFAVVVAVFVARGLRFKAFREVAGLEI
ncbi:MAG TPA: hypothetical protein VKO18_20160 [Terriglobia bacterium]|nr:hypothetical protein [Terriglobia bacterium]